MLYKNSKAVGNQLRVVQNAMASKEIKEFVAGAKSYRGGTPSFKINGTVFPIKNYLC